MRIQSLRIRNLRAIENFEVDELSDFIVIAGPNGCGKTTVLDALRLLKSIYVSEEWKRWFQEFGINSDRLTNISNLMRNPALPATIEARLTLAKNEREFLLASAPNIALGLALNLAARSQATVTGETPLVPPDLP